MTLTAAYVAGLVDGEGCISIMKSGRHHAPVVTIGMTKVALPILRKLNAEWGGIVDMHRPKTDKWAEAWRWMLHGQACGPFLRRIQPHLHLKREQCEVALALVDLRDSLVPTGESRAKWTQEASNRSRLMKDQMRELNAKGPSQGTPSGWIARLVGDQWIQPQMSLLTFGHLALFSGTWPASGSMRSGRVYERRTSALRITEIAGSPSHGPPTPRARDSKGRGREDGLPAVIELMPTPVLGTPRCSDGMQYQLRHSVTDARGRLEDQISMLPTPTVSEANGTGPPDSPRNDTLRAQVALLPTPRASENENRQTKRSPSQEAGTHGLSLAAEVCSLPTPTAGNFNDGESLESREARRARNKAKGINGNGQGAPLAITAQQLSGAPTSQPSADGSTSSDGLPLGQLSLDDLESG